MEPTTTITAKKTGEKTVSATVADVSVTITNSAAHIIAIIGDNLKIKMAC